MNTEERARELWNNLPIIQEKYIKVIKDALDKQKSIDDEYIHYLEDIVELTAILFAGMSSQWFSEPARLDGLALLRDKLIHYYEHHKIPNSQGLNNSQ